MKRIFMVGYSTDKGGVEAYIVNLCSQLPKEEYEVIYDWPTMEIDGKTWIRPQIAIIILLIKCFGINFSEKIILMFCIIILAIL